MQRDSVLSSILVATCLCIVCSVLVSTASVALKERQDRNKQQQIQEDVLKVAGLYKEGEDVAEQFQQQVKTEVAELATGQFVDAATLDKKAVDARQAIKNPELCIEIPSKEDLARLKRREKYSKVYLIKDSAGKLQQLILPVRGKGLWSTMYGFLSMEPDGRTVRGITFYEHGETPGLGGEIESKKFQQQWKGKVVRDQEGHAQFEFVRGHVAPDDPAGAHKIDGLAGATLTTRGVTNMILFWMGQDGYGPLLDRIAAEGAAQGGAESFAGALAARDRD